MMHCLVVAIGVATKLFFFFKIFFSFEFYDVLEIILIIGSLITLKVLYQLGKAPRKPQFPLPKIILASMSYLTQKKD